MNICFLDNTKFLYNSNDLHSPSLRGGETILINLSRELSIQGHKITILNNCPKNEVIDKICWKNINHYNDDETFDLVISNNNMILFDKIKSNKKILLSLSLQSFEKFVRKGQFLSYIKHKPKIALLGKYHLNNRPFYLRFYGNFIFEPAVDNIFIETKLVDSINSNYCIFTSRADRNMSKLINLWIKNLNPMLINKTLITTPDILNYNKNILFNENILFRKMGTQKELINDLIKSKICLIPGHKAELYCLAAEEARELCIPIVTLGIGSLSERVNHGVTGFVARNDKEFIDYTYSLFNEKSLWNNLRSNLLKLRASNSWSKVASSFISNC
jgi:hypothetical protein